MSKELLDFWGKRRKSLGGGSTGICDGATKFIAQCKDPEDFYNKARPDFFIYGVAFREPSFAKDILRQALREEVKKIGKSELKTVIRYITHPKVTQNYLEKKFAWFRHRRNKSSSLPGLRKPPNNLEKAAYCYVQLVLGQKTWKSSVTILSNLIAYRRKNGSPNAEDEIMGWMRGKIPFHRWKRGFVNKEKEIITGRK